MPLETAAYLAHLRNDGAEFGRAVAGALDRPVAGCPGWDGADLLAHLAGVHRWVTGILKERAQERPTGGARVSPTTPEEALEHYERGLGHLVSTLGATDPSTPVWTLPGAVAPAAFWFRRMAQETALHRWDAQAAAGVPEPVGTALAVDGIDEMLGVFLPVSRQRGRDLDLGGSLHIHTTDAEGEWTVRPGPDGPEVETGHGKGDAAVRGPAGDLLLFLWGRVTGGALETFGDEAVVRAWRRKMTF